MGLLFLSFFSQNVDNGDLEVNTDYFKAIKYYLNIVIAVLLPPYSVS